MCDGPHVLLCKATGARTVSAGGLTEDVRLGHSRHEGHGSRPHKASDLRVVEFGGACVQCNVCADFLDLCNGSAKVATVAAACNVSTTWQIVPAGA